MFHVDFLTGHVRMRPRQELARMVRYVAEKIGLATPTKDGLMPAADKAKLDDLGLATAVKDGLMPATDKAKLDGLRYPSSTNQMGLYSFVDSQWLRRLQGDGRVVTITFDNESKGWTSNGVDAFETCNYVVLKLIGDATFCKDWYKLNINDFLSDLYYDCGVNKILIINELNIDVEVILSLGMFNGEWYGCGDSVVRSGTVREATFWASGFAIEKPVLLMSEPLELRNNS